MKALFIYTAQYGCSRCDSLYYAGLIDPAQDLMTVVKAALERMYRDNPEELEAELDKDNDGELAYAILDLSQERRFLTSFEHECWHGILKDRVKVTKDMFDRT